MGKLSLAGYRSRSRLADLSTVAATSITDSFNRANVVSPIGNADTGQAWTVWQTGGLPTYGITSNTAYQSANGAGTDKDTGIWIDSAHVAVTLQVDITTAQAGNSIGGGLTFRHDSYQDFYNLMFYRSGGGSLFWFLQKKIANSYTTIANASASAITGTLKVVDTGSNIKVYIDGVQVGAGGGYSETALNTKTKQGLFMTYSSAGGANDGTGWRFDNYSVSW